MMNLGEKSWNQGTILETKLMNEAIVQEIGQRFQTAKRILVISHIRPDGDAVGSLLGLGLTLQSVGKQVQMVLADGLPSNLRFLSGSDAVCQRPEGAFDLTVVVDCSDLKRAGSVLDPKVIPDINIDHHVTNLNFAGLNLVDPQAVATAEILVGAIAAWGLPLTEPAAAALLTGLITDSLGFRTSNMTPKALRVAADLMECGANLSELYNQALVQPSFDAVRFWAAGLREIERKGRIVWTTLTMEDRKAAGYRGRDDADLINILSSIQDTRIAIIFVEQPNGTVKVSWRGQPGVDVSKLALGFGGGGHPAAAGAEIPGSLEEVRSKVLQATEELV
jgi:phosphoesterase RecJ-like protein